MTPRVRRTWIQPTSTYHDFLCVPQFIWSLIHLGGFENSRVDGNPSRIEVLEQPVTRHLRIPVIMGNKYTAPPTTTEELAGEERL